jgi:glyoxylase-like metal-dependent hydrolase (beta-lactamase superfamily II)
MKRRIRGILSLAACFLIAAALPVRAQSSDAKALLQEAAKAMGGVQALRSLKNQVVESEGKQFDHTSTKRPGEPSREVAVFRSNLTRDLTQPRLRLEWDGRTSYPRDAAVKWVELIDGSVGLLEEGSAGGTKPTRLHPARLATRLREEKRAPARLVLTALRQDNLRRLPSAESGGKTHHVLSFKDSGDEFHIYLDSKTKLPSHVDVLDYDPLEGDSRYTLRYADWRKVDGIMAPFSLRYELNGKPLQEEQIKSLRHNVTLAPETFSVPASIREQKAEAQPIASQWLMRRIATNTSYLDFGITTPVQFVQLADGVHQVLGTSHNNVVIEMRDHLVVVEAPLYESRSQSVIKAIKEQFPTKPIRYVIPTHFHLDHSGGIRAFMAEGAIVVTPAIARDFYMSVAKAPHTLRPDMLEKTKRAVVIESWAGDKRVLTDGSRQIELYLLPTSHAEDFQLVYLPREKILIEADHVSPRKNKVAPGPRVDEFLQGIEKLKLDVTTIAGIHGDTGNMEGLRAAAKGGKASKPGS